MVFHYFFAFDEYAQFLRSIHTNDHTRRKMTASCAYAKCEINVSAVNGIDAAKQQVVRNRKITDTEIGIRYVIVTCGGQFNVDKRRIHFVFEVVSAARADRNVTGRHKDVIAMQFISRIVGQPCKMTVRFVKTIIIDDEIGIRPLIESKHSPSYDHGKLKLFVQGKGGLTFRQNIAFPVQQLRFSVRINSELITFCAIRIISAEYDADVSFFAQSHLRHIQRIRCGKIGNFAVFIIIECIYGVIVGLSNTTRYVFPFAAAYTERIFHKAVFDVERYFTFVIVLRRTCGLHAFAETPIFRTECFVPRSDKTCINIRIIYAYLTELRKTYAVEGIKRGVASARFLQLDRNIAVNVICIRIYTNLSVDHLSDDQFDLLARMIPTCNYIIVLALEHRKTGITTGCYGSIADKRFMREIQIMRSGYDKGSILAACHNKLAFLQRNSGCITFHNALRTEIFVKVGPRLFV